MIRKDRRWDGFARAPASLALNVSIAGRLRSEQSNFAARSVHGDLLSRYNSARCIVNSYDRRNAVFTCDDSSMGVGTAHLHHKPAGS